MSPPEYYLRRMLLGVPEGANEMVPEHALPLESCMDIHGGGRPQHSAAMQLMVSRVPQGLLSRPRIDCPHLSHRRDTKAYLAYQTVPTKRE